MRRHAINQLFADLPRCVTFFDARSIMNQLPAIPANEIFRPLLETIVPCET